MSKPSILVCQQGARRRYAVPRMFEQEGMLRALHTDSSEHSLLGRCATGLGAAAPAVVRRLAQRTIRQVPRKKIYSSDRPTLHELMLKFANREQDRLQHFLERDRVFSRSMIKWGLHGADTVYSMYYENLDFIRWAKDQGAKSVIDVYISPTSTDITNREYAMFPDWGGQKDEDILELEKNLWRQAAGLADVLICPSDWVADGVRALTPAASGKIRIVPYGCSIDFNGRVNQPERGRILFAGGYALRKGLRYLAQAADRLKPLIPGLDVRVAGALPEEVIKHPLCRSLHFLGKLSMEQMKAEFLAADVFVLPSLSEGFAGVVAEAISAGCPVIVTRETGSPIQSGREGLIVPACDEEALAEAIRRMVEDRAFRQGCSEECLSHATFYSEEEWRKRLVPAMFHGR